MSGGGQGAAEAAPSAAELERRLAPATGWLREAAQVLPGLAGIDLDRILDRLEHGWVELDGERVHLEVHRAERTARATVVFVHGLGDHARRSTPLGGALADAGLNAILVDRHGHGLSDGRRGDATLEQDLATCEVAIRHARERFGGPVVLMGDSLGGIMTWYLLTREPEIDAAVCHCISHPDERHDPSMRWKGPLTRGLAAVAPTLPMPVTQIADYSQVALEPLTSRYFSDRIDPLFNFTVTLRSAASYTSFEPGTPWEEVTTPVLVTIGSDDRMVSQAHTERCLARAQPPRTTYVAHPGMGHQLYLDHLAGALPTVLAWIEQNVGEPEPARV